MENNQIQTNSQMKEEEGFSFSLLGAIIVLGILIVLTTIVFVSAINGK